MTIELKPCPCCGGEATYCGYQEGIVGCRTCGLSTGTYAMPEEAAAAWNQRVESKDAERLDWAERQYTDGLHIEKCCSGTVSGCNLKVEATVFHGRNEHRALTIREAIDDAMKAPQ